MNNQIWTVIWWLSFAALVASLIVLWWKFGPIVPGVVCLCLLGDMLDTLRPWANRGNLPHA